MILTILKYAAMVFIGFSSGVAIAGGVFAFITIIGIIPRLVQKTDTRKYIVLYENCIVLGGFLATLTFVFDVYLPLGVVAELVFGAFAGIFIGGLAVCLAETLDVLPIVSRRAKLKIGLQYFILSISLGKTIGSLIYFLYPGFIQFK